MNLSALDLTPWLVTRSAIPILVLGPAAIAGIDVSPLIVTALVAVPLLVGERIVTFAVLRRARRRGSMLDPP